MAATQYRGKAADYTIHESYVIDTRDREDHTFSGVMFGMAVKETWPIEFLEVNSLSVRGELGPLTVWVHRGPLEHDTHVDSDQWTLVYKATHTRSFQRLVPLNFDKPIRVTPGERVSLYVHSTLPNDMAIVYDNQHGSITHEDDFIQVLPGLAHLCNEPFGDWHPWGSWRRRREFVGQISYGTRYLLWNPNVNQRFPEGFRSLATLLLLIKPQKDCPLSWMTEDIIFYILNMMHPSWAACDRRSSRGSFISSGPAGKPRVSRIARRLSEVWCATLKQFFEWVRRVYNQPLQALSLD